MALQRFQLTEERQEIERIPVQPRGSQHLSSMFANLNNLPPNMIADVDFESTNEVQRLRVHIDITGGASAQASADESSTFGLHQIFVCNDFKPSATVEGLSFGKQVMMHHYPLHMQVHRDHGVIIYAQSLRCRIFQKIYHVGTAGLLSSVRKCCVMLLNDTEDRDVAERKWPKEVQMTDFESLVLRRMAGYQFRRVMIRKRQCSFYLYYVKKEGVDSHRSGSWASVIQGVGELSDSIDWAQGILSVVG